MSTGRKSLTHLAACLVGVLALGCNGGHHEGERVVKAGVIVIQLPEHLGELQRPPVEFDHPEHTKALEVEGCKACHPEVGGDGLSLKFGRTTDPAGRKALTDLYHDKCMGCHIKRQREGKRTGPRACGGCHAVRSPGVSARKPASFDYVLHDRHVKATETRGPQGELQNKCGTCHAFYDEAKKEFVYRDGVDGGAGDHHGSRDPAVRIKLRQAAHTTCITCHRKRKAANEKAGPVECKGCHARKEHGDKPKVVQKLVANQPVRAWIQAPGARSRLVGFNHKGHELQGAFCSTCHHMTLKACKECHTLSGSPAGNGVTMAQAYHAPASERSCIGCHQRQLVAKDCAGCHGGLVIQDRERSCAVCHRGPLPAGRDAPTTMPAPDPATVTDAPPLAALPASSEAFPEKIVIKELSRDYGPTELPHRKIVTRLDKAIRGSKLAVSFHGTAELMCSGCHHRSPAGARPSPCKACHSQVQPLKDQPQLKNAYHRQCIGCHQTMGIKRGCEDCHKKRGSAASREVGQ